LVIFGTAMKKVIISIVCLAFFVMNTGFVVNFHFCMNKLHSWQLGATSSEKCGKCGMDTGTSGCCHDEVKVVKLQQDLLKANQDLPEFTSSPFFVSFVSSFLIPSSPDGSETDRIDYSPPLPDHQKIYLENRVFRI
jgi:hypothetical protein